MTNNPETYNFDPNTGEPLHQKEAQGAQAAQSQGSPVPPMAGEYSATTPAPEKKRKSTAVIVLITCLVIFLLCGCCLVFANCAGCSGLDSMMNDSGIVTDDNTIAVIHIEGDISGESTTQNGPEYFYNALHAAETDDNVKAILLRIDSGGGTAAASEEMATYVAQCEKPVVVSMSDMGASGAYMIASQADYIYVLNGTTTGSIGVITTVYNVQGLLEKLGIEVENITSGANKGTGSYWSKLTDEQRELLQAEIDTINDGFIDLVASGRNMDRSEVEKLADGRTFSGQQAIDAGLCDEIGTYQDAAKKAAELAGISGDDYTTTDFDFEDSYSIDYKTLLSLLSSSQSTDKSASPLVASKENDEFMLLHI